MIKSIALCLLVIGLASAIPKREKHIDRGFTAKKAILKQKHYIGFNDISHVNVGPNFFNKEYGFFRAEKSGLHHFTFNLISNDTHFRISLRVNGKPQVWAFAQEGYLSAGNAATLYLNEGDVAYLYLEEGGFHEPTASYRGFGTFTGHRISFDETKAIIPRTSNRRVSNEERNTYDSFDVHIPSQWKNNPQ